MVQQDLSVNLIGKDVSASAALNRLAAAARVAARSAGDSLDQMNRRVETSSQTSLRTVTSGFGSNLASWAASGLAGVLGGITASVTSTVTGVVADAGQAILGELKSTVIDYNSQLEQATIGFTSMLGSGTRAASFLKELQQFAQITPFQFGDLTSYAQQMMAYGISSKNVVPYLTALGDAAAGAGKSSQDLGNAVLAFEQMAARGKVDLGDLNQLTQNGVPALAILADKYGVTKGKLLEMVSAGQLASDVALPKLIDGIEHGTKSTAAFGGMMSKQSKTLQGSMSNIQDAMDQTLSTAFKPFYTWAERGVGSLAKFATSKQVQNWAKDTSKTLSGLFNNKRLKSGFADLGDAVSKNLPALKSFAGDILHGIKDSVPIVADDLPKISHAVSVIGDAIKDNGPEFHDFITFLAGIPGTIADVINFFQILDVQVDTLRDTIHSDVGAVVNFFKDLPDEFHTIGSMVVQGLLSGLTAGWPAVSSAVATLVNSIPLAARKLLGIASPSKVMIGLMKFVGEGAAKGLLGTVSQVKDASSKLASSITDAFKNGTIGKGTENAALAALSKTTSKLKTLANERAKVLDKLSDLKSARTGVHDDTLSATLGYGDVTQYGAATGDATRGLGQLVSKTKTFTADLKKLVGKGVKGTLLTQLVDGWNSDPDNALATVQGLLANPTDLKQILGYESQLDTAGRALGAYAGHAEYDSQVNAAAGKAKVLTWEMQAAARSGLKTVSRDLHVHIAVNGTYAGTKTDLAKSITQEIRDAIKKGAIPKNWATA